MVGESFFIPPFWFQILRMNHGIETSFFLCSTQSDRPPLPPLRDPSTRDSLHREFNTLEEATAMRIQGSGVCFFALDLAFV